MTQKEKIEMLKPTIVFLYEKEGRSKSYISRLLDVNRKDLTFYINEIWELNQAKIRYLKPSNQKFLNKNKEIIKKRLDSDIPINKIAFELNVKPDFLSRTIIPADITLSSALNSYKKRLKETAESNKIKKMKNSSRIYDFEEIENERWKEICGHKGYYISDFGRVKKLAKRYNEFYLIKSFPNKNNGRLYVRIEDKNLQVSRLVGFAFVEGKTNKKNTINHIDGDVSNNYYKNLEWLTQGENLKHSYDFLNRPKNKAYQNKKFKKILLDGKEFSSYKELAAFLKKSETQIRRDIDANKLKVTFY